MKTVYDLSQEELEELRNTYFYQLLDTDSDVLGVINTPEEIPLRSIQDHYEGVIFVEEDFFCNINPELE